MTALYSHWSAPSGGEHVGWRTPEVARMGWALSVSLAARHYDDVVLVTDEPGRALIEPLDLPFTRIEAFGRDLSEVPTHLWSMGKLAAMEQQTRPFVHLDHDLFWLTSPPAFDAPLTAQSEEGLQNYRFGIAALDAYARAGIVTLPLSWSEQADLALNCGLVAARDLDLVRAWTTEAFAFVLDNLAFWRGRAADLAYYCWPIIIEQYLLACICCARGVEPAPLLGPLVEEAEAMGYVHLLSWTKRTARNEEKVQQRLEKHFPYTYNRIAQL